MIAALSDLFWHDVLTILGRPALLDDARFADPAARRVNAAACVQALDRVFATRTRREWLDAFRAIPDFPVTPVNSIEDTVSDPQAEANGYIVDFDHPVYGTRKTVGFPVSLSETPMEIRDRAPELGEHTERILIDLLGLDWQDINRLRDEEAI